MILEQTKTSSHCVELAKHDLVKMIRFVRVAYSLSTRTGYAKTLQPSLPDIALFNPGNDSVLMGYDFHISKDGPKLIEVNNNAGGLWLACQAHHPKDSQFSGRLGERLIKMFKEEFKRWIGFKNTPLKTVAIIDADPKTQFLFLEMRAYAKLFKKHGIACVIVDPQELTLQHGEIYYQTHRIEVIYNRHCDFYLETPELGNIRQAWLANQVCLTPNPHSYGLLADKRRMIDWSNPMSPWLTSLSATQQSILQTTVPKTRLLASENREQLWRERKHWVFKPVTAYASRGVYLGKKLTTGKFAELDPAQTLIQEYVEPGIYEDLDCEQYKVDYRLFVYRNSILSVAARIYQGQVTNLRTEGGGFVKVKIA